MSHIIIPGRAAKGTRPSGPFSINLESPQAQGLRGWWPSGAAPYTADLLQRMPMLLGGGSLSAVGVPGHGLAETYDGSTWLYSDVVPYSASGTSPFSMALWFSGVTVGGVYPVNPVWFWMTTETGSHTDGTADKGIGISQGGTGFSRARFYAYDGAEQIATGTREVMDVGPVLLVGTYDGATLRIYTNGVLDGSQACASTFAFTSPQFVWSYALTAQDVRGPVWDRRYYTKCLTAAEVWALYDPATRWDLYWTTPTRIYFDLAAAPPATPTRMHLPLLGVA